MFLSTIQLGKTFYLYPFRSLKIFEFFIKLLLRKRDKVSLMDDIYPTPPLGQDMTQGQFLSGI